MIVSMVVNQFGTMSKPTHLLTALLLYITLWTASTPLSECSLGPHEYVNSVNMQLLASVQTNINTNLTKKYQKYYFYKNSLGCCWIFAPNIYNRWGYLVQFSIQFNNKKWNLKLSTLWLCTMSASNWLQSLI